MMEPFRSEFNWMQREVKGLYPWVDKNHWEFLRRIGDCCCDGPWCHGHRDNGRNLIGRLLSAQVQENPLLDLFQKALVRAEIRFISRYILQRSNEERLTGNLVSELDAAVFLAQPDFRQLSKDRYQVEKEIDFFYYDLSRGGKVEKQTGRISVSSLWLIFQTTPIQYGVLSCRRKRPIQAPLSMSVSSARFRTRQTTHQHICFTI